MILGIQDLDTEVCKGLLVQTIVQQTADYRKNVND